MGLINDQFGINPDNRLLLHLVGLSSKNLFKNCAIVGYSIH